MSKLGPACPDQHASPFSCWATAPPRCPWRGSQRLRSLKMMIEMTKEIVPQSLKEKSTLFSAVPSRCWWNPANSPVSCHGADGRSGSAFLHALGLQQLHLSAPAQQSHHQCTQNSSSTLRPGREAQLWCCPRAQGSWNPFRAVKWRICATSLCQNRAGRDQELKRKNKTKEIEVWGRQKGGSTGIAESDHCSGSLQQSPVLLGVPSEPPVTLCTPGVPSKAGYC